MKQYIEKYNNYLGLNINNIYGNNIFEKYYNVYNKHHGFYYSVLYFKNKKTLYKGYYNMEQEYGHWIDNYQNSTFRYFL